MWKLYNAIKQGFYLDENDCLRILIPYNRSFIRAIACFVPAMYASHVHKAPISHKRYYYIKL